MTEVEPYREVNTMLLRRASEPPPTAVLATVLECTGGLAPTHIWVQTLFNDEDSAWWVVGATDRFVFEVRAKKPIWQWHGGDNRVDNGQGDEVKARVYPLSTFQIAEFVLNETRIGEFSRDDSEVRGLWTLSFRGGSIDLPTGATSSKESDRADARDLIHHVIGYARE